MGGRKATTAAVSHFELAPPRRFILPAILLLLSEQPGYGYGLLPRLEQFRFGHVDRPAVYRALAQLERDGLVEPSSQNPTAGQARRVYRITPVGERVLREWMAVVKDEHDHLGQVLRRYQATGTVDAVLAEVEGGWSSALGVGWSPVSSSCTGLRRLVPDEAGENGSAPDTGKLPRAEDTNGAKEPDAEVPSPSASVQPSGSPSTQCFHLVPDRSAVLIEVRSTVGPLSFGAIGVRGSVQAAIADGMVRVSRPSARLEIDVTGLRSGNRLYDAELLRRIEADRYPTAAIELREWTQPGPGNRFLLKGDLTFHRVTRPVQGTVTVEDGGLGRLVITGEQVFDIRDFAIPSPTVLMLRIYPDVRVRLHAEAQAEAST
jgi:PadR family transcriptional regulator, regulatory protein PadR